MNQINLYSVLLLFLIISSCGTDPLVSPTNPDEESMFDVEIGSSVIPYIVIDTKSAAIQNEPKTPATMTVYVEKEEVQSLNIGIEFRGSTSFRISDKKSYGIETWDESGSDIDVSLFGFPEEEDWVLIGHIVNLNDNYILDRTLMYHYFGYELFRGMGRYSSRTQFVELEINGDYKGVYVFMEKLKRGKDRIEIKTLEPTENDSLSITGGYILKIDKTSGGDLGIVQPLEYFNTNWDDDARYNEDISFRSAYDINGGLILNLLDHHIMIVSFWKLTSYMNIQKLKTFQLSKRIISRIIFSISKQHC